MKKQVLLTLVLVSAMCAAASAALVAPTITGWVDVNGNGLVDAPTDIIPGWIDSNANDRIDASDWLLIDIVYNGPPNMLAWNLIVQANGAGLLDGSGAIATGTWADPSFHLPIILGPNSVEVGDGNFAGIPDGTIYTEIWVHCEGPGPVIIEVLPGNAAGGSYDIYGGPYVGDFGQIVINQVPEPMTLSLLGLGGLALIRRRR
jgi:hypothetical protein